MTDQPTNPLVAGKSSFRPKATAEDIQACADEMNAVAAEHNCPWRYTVVPDENGKAKVHKVDYTPVPRLDARRDVMDRRGQRMTASETAELNTRLEYLGATARYREDGSKYFIERAA